MAPKPPRNDSKTHPKHNFLHKKCKKDLYFGTKIQILNFLSLNLIKHKNNFNLRLR